MKACAFFGHRNAICNETTAKTIYAYLEELICKENFSVFYFGGFGAFDTFCHSIITKLKNVYPYIQRVFCFTEQKYLRKTPKWINANDYEQFICPEVDFSWWYQRIYYRNCSIIQKSDAVIFYVNEKENSGAFKAMLFAKKNKTPYKNFGTLLF